MYVDNRIFIPIAAPFLLIVMAKAMFWFAGAPIESRTGLQLMVFFSAVLGGAGGTLLAAVLFEEEISLGGFHIGRKRDG